MTTGWTPTAQASATLTPCPQLRLRTKPVSLTTRSQMPHLLLAVPLATLAAFTAFGAVARLATRAVPAAAAAVAPAAGTASASEQTRHDTAYQTATRRDLGALCNALDRLDDQSQRQGDRTVVLPENEVVQLRRAADRVRDQMRVQTR